ncbi:MAG: hypothetical protein WC282_02050 [Bacilli bacterium]|jgi:hypothetical protein
MKKEDVASLIVYAIMIGLALFIGLGIIQPLFQNNPSATDNEYVFAILSVLVGVFINGVLIELGHILGGLIGKYRLQSVNLFGFCFYRKDDKVKFAFKTFEGLTGETKLVPKIETANPRPATILPLLLYLLELVAAILIYTLVNINSNIDLVWLSISAIIVASIGGMLTLYNIVPFKLDALTDGYRLTLFTKNINIIAYNELMLAENSDGTFQPRVFEEITDFTAEVNLIAVYRNIQEKNYSEAERILDKIIQNEKNTSGATHNRAIAQLLFLKIMNEPLEEAKAYHQKVDVSIIRFISNDLSMASVRAYLLIAGLLDESSGEVKYCLDRKKKAIKYVAPGNLEIEETLFNEALQKIVVAHPDWKFE